jgi:hypothetical protein
VFVPCRLGANALRRRVPNYFHHDWQGAANAAQIQAAGFAPSHPLESAIMITLNPGAYTVILQGVGGGQGIGVFAVYGL